MWIEISNQTEHVWYYQMTLTHAAIWSDSWKGIPKDFRYQISADRLNAPLCALLRMGLGVQWTHVFLSLNPHRFHKHVPIFLFLVRPPPHIFHIYIYATHLCSYASSRLLCRAWSLFVSLPLMEEYIKLIYDFVILGSLNAWLKSPFMVWHKMLVSITQKAHAFTRSHISKLAICLAFSFPCLFFFFRLHSRSPLAFSSVFLLLSKS